MTTFSSGMKLFNDNSVCMGTLVWVQTSELEGSRDIEEGTETEEFGQGPCICVTGEYKGGYREWRASEGREAGERKGAKDQQKWSLFGNLIIKPSTLYVHF